MFSNDIWEEHCNCRSANLNSGLRMSFWPKMVGMTPVKIARRRKQQLQGTFTATPRACKYGELQIAHLARTIAKISHWLFPAVDNDPVDTVAASSLNCWPPERMLCYHKNEHSIVDWLVHNNLMPTGTYGSIRIHVLFVSVSAFCCR